MSPQTQDKKNNIDEKLFTIKRKHYKKSHIKLNDEKLCTECSSNICTYICPANVYEIQDLGYKVNIQYENCLECGTCQVACEMHNINWTNPTEGAGIAYKNS